MYTNEGRKIAEARHDFMITYLNRLNNEIEANSLISP
jgi:hypothetical protein